MNSQITENYLKALFNLSQGEKDITISQLSEMMDVSIPTGHSMIKKLHHLGMVHYEKYKPIRLTLAGIKTSALIVRKHRLIEMFLVEIMRMGWEEVHDIAEQIEHVNSPLFFDKMDEMLGFPKVDPHGSPIPDSNGNWATVEYDSLADCNKGDQIKLVALGHSSKDLLHYLNRKELTLGTNLTILDKEDFDGSMTLSYSSNNKTLLSREVCEKLLVTKI